MALIDFIINETSSTSEGYCLQKRDLFFRIKANRIVEINNVNINFLLYLKLSYQIDKS